MNTSAYLPFLGTLWSQTGESLLSLTGPDAVLKVTAPPRDAHEITATSRILRVDVQEEGPVLIWLSHR